MVLPGRPLRIVFSGIEILGGLNKKPEEFDLVGLFNFILRSMQFSYQPIVVRGETPFILLNQSKADFAVTRFAISEKRSDEVAYNYPYAHDEITFVTRKPVYTPQIMALFQTLSLNVWLSLLVSIILFALVSFMVLKYRCSLKDVLFHVLAIVLNQEGNIVAKRAGEFLLLCTWLLSMALFTHCFKSVLLSFFTLPPLGGVRTVPELAAAIRDGKYRAFTIYGNSFPAYLNSSPNEDIRVIAEDLIKTPRGYFGNVKDTKYPIKALVFLRSYMTFAKEKMHLSKDTMATIQFGTAVSKDFCCKDEIDMLVHRFLAAGIDQKINRYRDHRVFFQYFSKQPDDEKNRKITMTDVSGAFILLVMGHVLSVCALIIELMMKRRETHHSVTNKK